MHRTSLSATTAHREGSPGDQREREWEAAIVQGLCSLNLHPARLGKSKGTESERRTIKQKSSLQYL